MEQNSYDPHSEPLSTPELVHKVLEISQLSSDKFAAIEANTEIGPAESDRLYEEAAVEYHAAMEGFPDYIKAFAWATFVNHRDSLAEFDRG